MITSFVYIAKINKWAPLLPKIHLIHAEMPSRSRTERREVPPLIHAEMYGMRRGGASYNKISQAYPPWTPKTVEITCKAVEPRKNHASLPRSGAPSKFTEREECELYREARRSVKSHYQPLAEINTNVVPQLSRRSYHHHLKF